MVHFGLLVSFRMAFAAYLSEMSVANLPSLSSVSEAVNYSPNMTPFFVRRL